MDAIWVPPERRLISGQIRSGEVFWNFCISTGGHSRLPRSIQQHENQPSWSTSSLFSSLEHLHRCSECVIILHSKIGWRKVKMCRFNSGNCFCLRSPRNCKVWGWLVKGAATLCHQHKKKKECNKFDLTAAQCFWLAYHNDWPKWFAISSSPTYLLSHCCSVFLIGLS
jgi:hypothetical protein